jgi:hypothetical protein
MRSRVHTSVANPCASALSSSARSIASSWSSATLGRRPVGPRVRNAVVPSGMPAAGALARDVQLAGDLSLGTTLGEQLGGPFPTGLAGGPLLGGPRSGLLLAAVGGHGRGCSHTSRPTSP